MTTLKEHEKKTCQVHNCKELGDYYNPESGMVYCEICKEKLGGKIIYQKADKVLAIKEQSVRLLKIQIVIPDFDIMKVE